MMKHEVKSPGKVVRVAVDHRDLLHQHGVRVGVVALHPVLAQLLVLGGRDE